jgi:hypothetical protein
MPVDDDVMISNHGLCISQRVSASAVGAGHLDRKLRDGNVRSCSIGQVPPGANGIPKYCKFLFVRLPPDVISL